MEYMGQLANIDSEHMGETWIDALILQFNFPDNPRLFECLTDLNQRVKSLLSLVHPSEENESGISPRNDQVDDTVELSPCQCQVPYLQNVFYWTKYFEILETKMMIVDTQEPRRNRSYKENVHKILSPEEHVLNLAKQGVVVIKNYVSPQCQDDEEHTAWRLLTDNLVECITNNLPNVLFVFNEGGLQEYPYLHKDLSRVFTRPSRSREAGSSEENADDEDPDWLERLSEGMSSISQ